MGCRGLFVKGAERTEPQTFLTQGGMVSIAIHDSGNLRQTSGEEASFQGMGFMAFMRPGAIRSLTEDREW